MNKKLYFNLIFIIAGSFVMLIMASIVVVNVAKDSRIFAKNEQAVAQATPTPKPTATPKATQQPSSTNKPSTTLVFVRETPQPQKPKVDSGESMVIPSISPAETSTPVPTTVPTTPGAGTPSPGASPAAGPGVTPTPKAGTPSPDPVKTPVPTPAQTTPKPEVQVVGKIKVEVINYTDKKALAELVRASLEAEGYEVSTLNSDTIKPVKTEILERNDKNAGAAVRGVIKVGKVTKAADPGSRYDVTVILGDDFPQ